MDQPAGIPWWGVAILVGYTSSLIWIVTTIFERTGKLLITAFLFRVLIIAIGVSYWEGPVCDWMGAHFGLVTFELVTIYFIGDAARMMHFVLVKKPYPPGIDDLMIVFWTAVMVVFPAGMMFLVFKVLLAHQCRAWQ